MLTNSEKAKTADATVCCRPPLNHGYRAFGVLLTHISRAGSAWDVSPRGPKLDFKLPSQEGGEPMSTSRSARMGMSPRTDLSNIPVSPMVDGIWGGIGDMDGILSEPMSARAWASHLPDPDSKRQSSGIAREASSVGREVSGLASIARARAEVSGLDSILREPSLGALGTPRSLADPWAGAGTR